LVELREEVRELCFGWKKKLKLDLAEKMFFKRKVTLKIIVSSHFNTSSFALILYYNWNSLARSLVRLDSIHPFSPFLRPF
jgi:hypothetical protein